MKLWEIAKKKYNSLGKNDFIYETCPDLLGIEGCPEYCHRKQNNNAVNIENCKKCWERELHCNK